ncbi:MAG TPA: 50S ribosomal protein L6 [Thermoplasmata archaeon]|jgi:large subunit ribosomal protein L6|nr:50S ribosomal protein L6 [Thermoplasmata archaeon]
MSTDPDRAREVIEVPPSVTFSVAGGVLTAKGPLGSVARPFPADVIELSVAPGTVTLLLRIPAERKRSQSLLKTWAAHVRNLAGGLTRGVEARMKVVAAHFPMKVSVRGEELVIENFLGEKFPRTTRLRPGTKAAVEGEIVTLSGHDVEQVGQSAANIERVTHIRDYDPRVFQDGIYLIERAHLKEGA